MIHILSEINEGNLILSYWSKNQFLFSVGIFQILIKNLLIPQKCSSSIWYLMHYHLYPLTLDVQKSH